MSRETKPVDQLAEKWKRDPKFRAEYDALEEEFTLAAATGTRLKITFEPQAKR